MLKRHADKLENILDRLAYEPIVEISKRYLRHITGADRLSKNAYRDIFDRLPETIDINKLSCVEDGDVLYIIRSEYVKKASGFI